MSRILFFIVFIFSCSLPCHADNTEKSNKVPTTLQRTIVPDKHFSGVSKIFPYEIAKYKENGYGVWHYGPGLSYIKRLDIMPAKYNGSGATSNKKLLNFFTISDIHITDKESPAQAIYLGYKFGSMSAYSGIMLYTTHVLDAIVQTINSIHKQDPFDFGISLGDTCNATQYNELRWYLDVIDGKNITPSSGNHAGADKIDYQKPYKAVGLDKSISWYQVMGNHDHFWMGYVPANDYIKQHLIGDKIINLGNLFIDPLGVDSRGYYMGSIDGGTPYGNIIGVGPTKDFNKNPSISVSDSKRYSLSRKQWIKEFFNTSSKPKGHGFNEANIESGFACYTFAPKPNLPIKVIVLDDTQRDDDSNDPVALGYGKGSFGYGHGALDNKRYDWLIKELDKGQAEGKLMIIAAHIPIGVEPAGSMMAWNQTLEKKLIAKLHTYPNLILWLAGHRHINQVTAFKSPDVAHPEFGFWQIETSSLRDFPQQFRSFTINFNSDKTISIFATNVDPVVKDGSPAAISRSYAVAANEIFDMDNKIDKPLRPYNAECIKQLTVQMQTKLSKVSGN